jgi:hypothetical protein
MDLPAAEDALPSDANGVAVWWSDPGPVDRLRQRVRREWNRNTGGG